MHYPEDHINIPSPVQCSVCFRVAVLSLFDSSMLRVVSFFGFLVAVKYTMQFGRISEVVSGRRLASRVFQL